MFYRMVEKIVRDGFKHLSTGDYEAIVKKFSPNISFRFVGDHAMGANLHDLSAIRAWFQRMLRLFPGIQFEVQDIKVSGTPWNTLVTTRLGIRANLQDGHAYQNTALQVLRLHWGRVIEDYVCEDTYVLIQALNCLAEQGVPEAKARPIVDAAA